MYYYIEILENGEITSFGESTSMDLALKNTTHQLLEITEEEYKLVSACRGNLSRGINKLNEIEYQIAHFLEDIKA